MGWLLRIWLKISVRLICLGTLFDALNLLVKDRRGVGISAIYISDWAIIAVNSRKTF
jgi:hypothetical protein